MKHGSKYLLVPEGAASTAQHPTPARPSAPPANQNVMVTASGKTDYEAALDLVRALQDKQANENILKRKNMNDDMAMLLFRHLLQELLKGRVDSQPFIPRVQPVTYDARSSRPDSEYSERTGSSALLSPSFEDVSPLEQAASFLDVSELASKLASSVPTLDFLGTLPYETRLPITSTPTKRDNTGIPQEVGEEIERIVSTKYDILYNGRLRDKETKREIACNYGDILNWIGGYTGYKNGPRHSEKVVDLLAKNNFDPRPVRSKEFVKVYNRHLRQLEDIEKRPTTRKETLSKGRRLFAKNKEKGKFRNKSTSSSSLDAIWETPPAPSGGRGRN